MTAPPIPIRRLRLVAVDGEIVDPAKADANPPSRRAARYSLAVISREALTLGTRSAK
jgi:hypothetical protein